MKTGRSLQDLAAELDRQRQVKKDYLIDTRSLYLGWSGEDYTLDMFDGAATSQNKMAAFAINEHTHRQIANRLNIPAKYYDRMREEFPGLLQNNVNGWFNNSPETRMVRVLDGTARAFLSDSYRRIDNFEIAETVLPVIFEMEDAQIESCEVTENRMYIKVVNPRLQDEVSKGDIVQSGLVISNSEIGLGSVKVQPLIYRLVCLNGMIVNDAGIRKYHVGRTNESNESFEMYSNETLKADDAAFMMKVRDITRSVIDEVQFKRVIDMMKEASGARITSNDIPRFVELAASDYHISQGESKGILDHLIKDGNFSLYGLSCAVTRYSQDVQSYDRATELESIGYDILTMPKTEWKTLNSSAA